MKRKILALALTVIVFIGAVPIAAMAEQPVPVVRVGVRDCFGRSGNALELLKLYHLTAEDIALAAKQAIQLKK